MAGSLAGIRVLELARYQAGPRGGMILSDLGAEVIKIEKLGGEETRRSEPIVRGQSVYFAVYNRGKKSLCLDMRTPRGKEIFAALVPTGSIASAIYTYDQVGRLTTALYDNGVCVAYAYDANGNRTSQINTLGGTPASPIWGSGVWGCFSWTPH